MDFWVKKLHQVWATKALFNTYDQTQRMQGKVMLNEQRQRLLSTQAIKGNT